MKAAKSVAGAPTTRKDRGAPAEFETVIEKKKGTP